MCVCVCVCVSGDVSGTPLAEENADQGEGRPYAQTQRQVVLERLAQRYARVGREGRGEGNGRGLGGGGAGDGR